MYSKYQPQNKRRYLSPVASSPDFIDSQQHLHSKPGYNGMVRYGRSQPYLSLIQCASAPLLICSRVPHPAAPLTSAAGSDGIRDDITEIYCPPSNMTKAITSLLCAADQAGDWGCLGHGVALCMCLYKCRHCTKRWTETGKEKQPRAVNIKRRVYTCTANNTCMSMSVTHAP